jgi:uncharacterized protein (DUF427 family)
VASTTGALESVLDYPTPPKLERTSRHLKVEFAGEIVAETRNGFRVLETNHPPVYFFPPDDVRREYMVLGTRKTRSEWLGEALRLSVRVGSRLSEHAALMYPEPDLSYMALRDCVAFYAGRMDRCYVNGERVVFAPPHMAGWITRNLIIPYEGVRG